MLDISLDDAGPADEAGLFEFAQAKINLALHVTGQRADGYHLLESIVTFASAGDRLTFLPAARDGFTLSGRFGADFSPDGDTDAPNNLVQKARDLLRAALESRGSAAPPVAIHLKKNLPIASGIGGGSADAAAALRGLIRFWGTDPGEDELTRLALSLGADVPMCLSSKPLLARGIGEDLTPLDAMPSFAIVLGNPLVAVSTPDIFRRLPTKNNAAIPALSGNWRSDLAALRNDLEPVARALAPEIAELSGMIAAEGAWLTRMSGSGATCFGLFDTFSAAEHAADTMRRKKPDWYFIAAQTVGAIR
jgi:4-diphosphocytidyl-2-C-methyl-D-erythritol kinase